MRRGRSVYLESEADGVTALPDGTALAGIAAAGGADVGVEVATLAGADARADFGTGNDTGDGVGADREPMPASGGTILPRPKAPPGAVCGPEAVCDPAPISMRTRAGGLSLDVDVAASMLGGFKVV